MTGLDLPATSTPNHNSIKPGAERLCAQAEALIASLSSMPASSTRSSALEFVVDGYAHVLALDVDRRRLEREITRLAEIGDPEMVGQLSELSALLRRMARASEDLRDRLSELRARLEACEQR
jgi:hypothetical protein